MRKTFDSLTSPLDHIVTDTVLLLDENVAVFPEKAFWNNKGTRFYPDFFCVDDLSYQEWYELLEENMGGFMPVHHITAYEGEMPLSMQSGGGILLIYMQLLMLPRSRTC